MNKYQGPPWTIPGFDVWLAIARTYQLCERAISQGVARHGLSLAQHDVLANVVRSPGLTQQEIADRLLVARSNVSMLLTGMEQDGLLERVRDSADARIRRVMPTARGRAVATATLAAQAEVVRAMISAIESAELETIGTAMDKVEARLRSLLAEAAPGRMPAGSGSDQD